MQFFNPYPNDCQPLFFIPGLHTLTPGSALDGVPVDGPQPAVQPPSEPSSTSWISEAVAEAANEQRTPTDPATDPTCLGGPSILYLNDLWRFTSGIFEPPPGIGLVPRSEAGRRLLKRRQKRQQRQQQETVLQPTDRADEAEQCKGSLPVEELLAFITDNQSLKHQNTNDSKTASSTGRRRSGASRKKGSKLTDLTSCSSSGVTSGSDDRDDVTVTSQKHQEMLRIENGGVSNTSEDVSDGVAPKSRDQFETISGSPSSSAIPELQDDFVVVRRNRKLKCSTASSNERPPATESTASGQSEKHQQRSPVRYGVDGFQRKNKTDDVVEKHRSQDKPTPAEKKSVILKSHFTDQAGQTRIIMEQKTSSRPAAVTTLNNSCTSSNNCHQKEESQRDEKEKIPETVDTAQSSEAKFGTIQQNGTDDQLNETELAESSSDSNTSSVTSVTSATAVTSVHVAGKSDATSTSKHADPLSVFRETTGVIVGSETMDSADNETKDKVETVKNQTKNFVDADVEKLSQRSDSVEDDKLTESDVISTQQLNYCNDKMMSPQTLVSVDPVVFLDVKRRSGGSPSSKLIDYHAAADIDISFGFDPDDSTTNLDDRSTSSSSARQPGSCAHCGAKSDSMTPRTCGNGVESTMSGSCRVDPVASASGVIDVHCHVVVHQVSSFCSGSQSGRVLPLHAPLSGSLNHCSPSRAPVGIVPPIQQQWEEAKNTGGASGASSEFQRGNVSVANDQGHVPDFQVVLRLQNSDASQQQQQQLTEIQDKLEEMETRRQKNSDSCSYIDDDDTCVESTMRDGQFDLLGMQIFLYKGFEEALAQINGSPDTDIKSRIYK